jgi:Family of unknown function (DUF5946)
MTDGGPDGQILGPAQWTTQREWHPPDGTSACPGCGLVLPVHAGPTHAYMGASPACWRLYGQASTLSWGSREGLPLLRLVVDAYGAQHPGTRQVRAVQSVAVHLMGLCKVLERGAHPEPIRAPARGRPPARTTLDLHWLEPPRPNGTLTVRGPLDAVGGDDHAASVEAWARDVWAAWTVHHETVRGWLDRAVSSPRRA